ncbi:MAG: amidohydrolase family protein [Phycisphaerales bacterium]|nr:amidohydrolase family protein [Phycisphaerales bacterium]
MKRTTNDLRTVALGAAALALAVATALHAQVAVRGDVVHTMSGAPITDGVVVITDGRISAVGPAATTPIPAGVRVLRAAVVTPGLIDAHGTVGVAGALNSDHDQDQLEHADPMQPELRAIDAYNTREMLVEWVRSFGVTTIHTGHAPGELISGQTMIVKTTGNTVDEAMLVPLAAVAVTLSPEAQRGEGKSPGTRGKMAAMLRGELIKARDYLARLDRPDADDDDAGDEPDDERHRGRPDRDLRLETLGRVLNGEVPLLVTADRAQDIASALRIAAEFDIRVWLDSAAESYLLVDEIKAAGVPVILHPSMARAVGVRENQSFETAATLRRAGIPVAIQAGYESYVPKTRIVLFEAAIAAANGLTFEEALATITIDAARILGIDDRVGALAVGRDGDVALYDGDPFEYTSHCIGVVIDGAVVSEMVR